MVPGYPTLLYFHKKTFQPVEYKGTRDLPSLTLFLSEVYTIKAEVRNLFYICTFFYPLVHSRNVMN